MQMTDEDGTVWRGTSTRYGNLGNEVAACESLHASLLARSTSFDEVINFLDSNPVIEPHMLANITLSPNIKSQMHQIIDKVEALEG